MLDTIRKGFPLNVMYWMRTLTAATKCWDGQQRTVSFCQYVNNDFSIDNRAFHNLTAPEQELDSQLHPGDLLLRGRRERKADWFRIINIAGLKLTEQEMRNAVYTGPRLTHAKSIFSKSNCAAYGLANKYVNGFIRQEILETALDFRYPKATLKPTWARTSTTPTPMNSGCTSAM